MRILFATNNEHKIREINAILPDSIELLRLSEAGYYDDIPETGNTLEENALMKARRVFELTGIPTFADDTGLEIDSLGGEPGVRSARFAGDNKDMNRNIALVLERLESKSNRRARFRTVIALVTPKGEYSFEGTVSGIITGEKRGTSGFGYDPVFMPDGSTFTFAEMTQDKKNDISHRSAAFRKLAQFLAGATEI